MTTADWNPWDDYEAVKAEAAKGGSNTPLPVGNYNVTLYEASVEPFSKNADSPYAKFAALAITLQVADGGSKGRRIWDRVGLFPKFAPTQKNPQGAVNRSFFNFFQKSLGLSDEALQALSQKIAKGQDISEEIRSYLGAAFSVKTRIEEQDGYDPQTKVAFFNAPAAQAQSAAVSDAWAQAAPVAKPDESPWPGEDAPSGLLAAAASSKGF